MKPTQVALAWLLAKPGVTAPIVGASKISHLDEAVESLKVQLSPEDIKLLEEPYKPHRVLGTLERDAADLEARLLTTDYRLPTTVVPLNRALSKLGILSRAQATEAIRAGRVKVDGRVVTDPATSVVPERARITVDGQRRTRAAWRTILFHKPRGVVTTRRDPEGRRRSTTSSVPPRADSSQSDVSISPRSGLLLLTTDTRLAHRITDPANAVPRCMS